MRARSWSVLVVAALAACQGEGSDIGPALTPLPDSFGTVLVRDAQDRGVTGARVDLGGRPRGVTGRSGRAELNASPGGRQVLTVDGRAAAAVDGDRLGVLTFTATYTNPDLPFVVYLPDAAPSAGLALSPGVLGAPAVLDDSATSGAVVTIPAGVTVGGSAPFTLRTGTLVAEQLPGEPLRTGANLFGRGIYIDPPELNLSGGATLNVPDDLRAPNGSPVDLYRLDPQTGDWTLVASTTAAGGGAAYQFANAVTAGGLFACGTAATANATVTGRLLTVADVPVQWATVRVDQGHVVSGGDGRFRIENLVPAWLDGTPRAPAVVAHGGGGFLPIRATAAAVLTGGGVTDVGDVDLDTFQVFNVNLLAIRRGVALAHERLRMSSGLFTTADSVLSGSDGHALIEEIGSGWSGFVDGRPFDRYNLDLSAGQFYQPPEYRWANIHRFFGRLGWNGDAENGRGLAMDSLGSGPVPGAALTIGRLAEQGLVGFTNENGQVFTFRDFGQRGTFSVTTTCEGRTVISAFSIEDPNNDRAEFPLQRAMRSPRGQFGRHGLVAGNLVGANGALEHRLRSVRRLSPGEWQEQVMIGAPVGAVLPVDIDPAGGGAAYQAGVAAGGGNVAVAEGSTAAGVFTLARLGLGAEVVPVEGGQLALDVDIAHTAGQSFVVPQVLGMLDPGIAPAALGFDLGLLRSNGTVADAVRGVGGNHTAAGADVTFMLPALAGTLAGGRWLVAFGGQGSSGGVTVRQQVLARLQGNGNEAAVPMLAVPVVSAPAPGAVVAADGFTVSYAAPTGASYLTIHLRSDTGAEVLDWFVVAPPTRTETPFVELPLNVPTPLRAGRTYTLTVSAHRIDEGDVLLAINPYFNLTGFLSSIDVYERGVRAISSRSFTITTN